MKPFVTMQSRNPNLVEDMLKYLSLENSQVDIETSLVAMKKSSPKEYSKLELFMDRLEFIDHLDKIVEFVAALLTPYRWKNQNSKEQEVVGVENDIEPLRLYLALTCVDILSDKSDQVGKRFKEVFSKSPQDIIDDLVNHLIVIRRDLVNSDLGLIVDALYNIRNSYTHDGIRFHSLPNTRVRQIQKISAAKGAIMLAIEPDFDLIEAVLNVAISNVKMVLANHCIQ